MPSILPIVSVGRSKGGLEEERVDEDYEDRSCFAAQVRTIPRKKRMMSSSVPGQIVVVVIRFQRPSFSQFGRSSGDNAKTSHS